MGLAIWKPGLFGGLVALGLVAGGCGGRGTGKAEPDRSAGSSAGSSENQLTPFELENGIGPVKEKVVVGPVDRALAATGKGLFETKCSMCHKMDSTYVGPSLGEVTARRTPAYIMNMILNPQEMV